MILLIITLFCLVAIMLANWPSSEQKDRNARGAIKFLCQRFGFHYDEYWGIVQYYSGNTTNEDLHPITRSHLAKVTSKYHVQERQIELILEYLGKKYVPGTRTGKPGGVKAPGYITSHLENIE